MARKWNKEKVLGFLFVLKEKIKLIIYINGDDPIERQHLMS